MSYRNDYDLFVAGKTGAFKGVQLASNEVIVKNLQNVKILKPKNEISVLRWDTCDEHNVLIGTVDQHVKVYDCEFKAYSTCLETLHGSGPIVGLARYQEALTTCSESGHIKVWKFNEDGLTVHAEGPVSCMQSNLQRPETIATGGKCNDLKIWNLETKTKIFNAKNVKKDMLELEVPIWVSDIKFLPDSEFIVAICTKYGHVRLYDIRVQRRPVINVQLTNQTLNCLSLCAANNQVVTGSATGFMLSVDIRGKGKVLHSFKGAVGSIRSIASDPIKPYVASVGLDRYMRIHHLETRKSLHQAYLKVRLNCVLMTSTFMALEEKRKSPDKIDETAHSSVDCFCSDDSDEEYNKMFDNMETVHKKSNTHKHKKQKLQ